MDASHWQQDPAYLIALLQEINPAWLPPSPERYKSFRCPLHDDRHPSAGLYQTKSGNWRFKCHGCGLNFDAFTLVRYKQICKFPDAVRWLERRFPSALPATQLPAKPACEPVDWPAEHRRWRKCCRSDQIARFAGELGVTPAALNSIGLGRTKDAWVFPERDGTGKVIGLGLRYASGRQIAMKGSRRGLTLPGAWRDFEAPILIVEGPTDAAACLTMGLPVIGRAAAFSSLHLAEAIGDRSAVIVVEQDRRIATKGPKKGKLEWPGRDGACKVAEVLRGVDVDVTVSPCRLDGHKDPRVWFREQEGALTNVRRDLAIGRDFMDMVLERRDG